MKLQYLKFENFRGAKNLQIKFHSEMNVLIGVNGSGKSSILDGAAIMMSWVANRLVYGGGSGRPMTENDISNRSSIGTLSMCATYSDSAISWKGAWHLVKARRGHGKGGARSELSGISGLIENLRERVASTEERINLPVLIYYPVNRAVVDIPLRIRSKHKFALLSAYDESLTSGANFRTFFEWFREREDLENESARYQNQLIDDEKSEYPDRQLEAVRYSLSKFMPDFDNLTVRRSPLRMEVEKSGVRLNIDQLSGGEKCLMALVGDLARRLAIANPVLDNPLEGKGVVMIDEVDLHLHPKWQAMIVPSLRQVFPNCQFLVTTHSPHVVTQVDPESLFELTNRDGQLSCSRPADSFGKTAESILRQVMGLSTTRPKEVDEDFEKLWAFISQGDLSKAEKLLSSMKEKVVDDPDLSKAKVLIQRKKLIGR